MNRGSNLFRGGTCRRVSTGSGEADREACREECLECPCSDKMSEWWSRATFSDVAPATASDGTALSELAVRDGHTCEVTSLGGVLAGASATAGWDLPHPIYLTLS